MKCCDVTPGMLRHSVRLQRPDRQPDGVGGVTVVWNIYAAPKAAINPLSGSETLRAMRRDATVTHRALMRYRPDVVALHRLAFRGSVYQILAVRNLEERNRWLELDLQSGVAT